MEKHVVRLLDDNERRLFYGFLGVLGVLFVNFLVDLALDTPLIDLLCSLVDEIVLLGLTGCLLVCSRHFTGEGRSGIVLWMLFCGLALYIVLKCALPVIAYHADPDRARMPLFVLILPFVAVAWLHRNGAAPNTTKPPEPRFAPNTSARPVALLLLGVLGMALAALVAAVLGQR